MVASGYAALPIIPSFEGVYKELEKTLGEPLRKAMESAGKDMEKSLTSSAKKTADAVERARYRERKATEELQAAESKRRENLLKHEAAEKSLQASAERLAKARKDGVKDVLKLEEQHLKAQARAEKANFDLKKSEQGVIRAREEMATATQRVKERTEEYAKASDEASRAAERSGNGLAISLDKIAVGAAAAAGALAAAGGALTAIGGQFDDAYDSIRIGTGASGEAFEGLQDSFRKIAGESIGVGSDLGAIGTTLADVNTRLGLTGKPLEELSTQLLQLENMGVDASINEVSQAFTGFGVAAEDMPAALDELFRVSQATGLTVTDLANSAVKAGPQLRAFGFSMSESAALVGSLDKAGIDADKTLGFLSRAMVQFAEDGLEPRDALNATVSEIEAFIAAGNSNAAIGVAENLFGTKGATAFVDAVKSGQLSVEDFMGAAGVSGDTISGLAAETADWAEQLDLLKNQAMLALEPLAMMVFDQLAPALETAGEALQVFATWITDSAVPGLQDFGERIRENQGWIMPLAAAIGGAAGAFALWTGAIKAWKTVTEIAAGVQAAFNAVMAANPVMLAAMAIAALVAGLTVFFTKTETGQQLWEQFTSALSAGWEWVSTTFNDLWENIIKPVFDGFVEAGKFLFGVISTAVLTPLMIQWELLSTVFQAAWENIIKPVFDGFMELTAWLWENAVRPAFEGIAAGWDQLGQGISAIYEAWVRPVIDGFAAAFDWLVNSVFTPLVDLIRQGWENLGNVFSAVGGFIKDTVFGGLSAGVDALRGAFSVAVDAIGTAWDRLRDLTRRPVEFIVNTVYNNGIRKAWNSVGKLVGLSELPEHRFATGGILPGYTPGRDIYEFIEPRTGMRIGLSGGEPILRPEAGRVLGADWVDGINAAARMNGEAGVAKFLGGFASGGIVESISAAVRKNFPGMTITSTYRNTADHHGAGKAVDFSDGTDSTPGMRRAAEWFYANYGKGLLELIHSPFGNNVKNGQNVGDGFGLYGAGTMQAHRNHVHVAAPSPLGDPTTMVEQIAESGGSIFNPLNAVKAAWDAVISKIPGFAEAGQLGLIGQLPAKFMEAVASKAWQFITETVGKMGVFSGPSGSAGSAESWREMAMAAMRRNGFNADDPAQVNAMLAQIMSESGGNPGIAQQIVDVNGTGESAGVGLLQIIPGTFAAHRDPALPNDRRDPWANMNAALRYYRSRYGGDLTTMWGKGHGYATGGIVPSLAELLGVSSVGVYDTGGVLPPGGVAVNHSRFNEVVINGPKLEALDRLAKNVGALTGEIRATMQQRVSEAGTVARGFAERIAGIADQLGLEDLSTTINAFLDAEKQLTEYREGEIQRMEAYQQAQRELEAAQEELRQAMSDAGSAAADNGEKVAEAERKLQELRAQSVDPSDAEAHAQKVKDAEAELARVRESGAQSAAQSEQERADRVKKANESVAKAEKGLQDARAEQLRNLDITLYDMFPGLHHGLTGLAGAAASAGPAFQGAANAINAAALSVGPAGLSLGGILNMISTAIGFVSKIFKMIRARREKWMKANISAWDVLANTFQGVSEWYDLLDKRQQAVSKLQQQLVRDTLAMAKAQLEFRIAAGDRAMAEQQGITNTARAAAALWEYEGQQRLAQQRAMRLLSGDVDRLRWSAHAALDDAAFSVEQTREWRALAFDYFRTSAEADRNNLAAQESMLNAMRNMAQTTLSLQRSQQDLVIATRRLNEMTAETFGMSRSGAAVGTELAEVSKQIAETQAELQKANQGFGGRFLSGLSSGAGLLGSLVGAFMGGKGAGDASAALNARLRDLTAYRDKLLSMEQAPDISKSELDAWQSRAANAIYHGADASLLGMTSPFGEAELANRFAKLQDSLADIDAAKLNAERLIEDLELDKVFDEKLLAVRAEQYGFDQMITMFERLAEAEREDNALIRDALLDEAAVARSIAEAMGVTPISVSNLHDIPMPDVAPRNVTVTHMYPGDKTSFSLDEVRALLAEQDRVTNSTTALVVGPSAEDVADSRRARI